MTLTVKAFIDKFWPHALTAAHLLNVAPRYAAVFLTHNAHESGYEGDGWVGNNNYAGITHGGPPNFLKYDTIEQFISDYIHVFTYTFNGRGDAYKDVLNAMRNGESIENVLTKLGQSPWDYDHYGRNYGLPDGELLQRKWREIQPLLPSGWDGQDVTRETPTAPTVYAFADVPANHWAVDLWKEALDRGIVHGDTHGNLHPDAPITRSEALVMSMNAAKYTFNHIKELIGNGGTN